VRVAEWVEQYPQVEDLVIDTAPGLHALDFLTKPQKVASFLDSKIMDWLKWFVGDSSQKSNLVTLFFKSSARKILDGLSMVGGKAFILNFSEFLILLDEVFITALERLKYTQKWLKHSSTNIIFVSSLREDSVLMVKEMNKMLNDLGKSQRIAVINRCLPVHLKKEKSFQNFVNADALTNQNEHLFRNYLFSYYYNELRVKKEFLNFSKFIIQVPVYANFDSNFDLRLQDLCALGDQIRQQAGNHFL
jgi:anion-transporting  ArsA/GET3 family ATPase